MVELVGNIPDDAVLQAQLDILYGQTPDITIKAHELPEESEPTVEKSGTLAEPIFDIGIPQAMGAVAAREYAKQAETARDAAILAGETAKEELNGIVASADDALDQKIAETGTLLDEKVATAAQRASEAASSAVAAAQKATAAEQAMQGAQAAQAQAEQSAQEAADSAASINPSVYMQKSVYDPGNEQQPLLPRNGDGSNVTASFTEAEQDADIQTGEELTVLFGKIKKRFSTYDADGDGVVDRAAAADRVAKKFILQNNAGQQMAEFDGSADRTVQLTPGQVGAEPAFTKNNAFNKNFGSAAGTVCQGNDGRLSNARRASNISMSLSGTTLTINYS